MQKGDEKTYASLAITINTAKISGRTCRGKFMFNPATSFDNWDKKKEKKRRNEDHNKQHSRAVVCS